MLKVGFSIYKVNVEAFVKVYAKQDRHRYTKLLKNFLRYCFKDNYNPPFLISLIVITYQMSIKYKE